MRHLPPKKFNLIILLVITVSAAGLLVFKRYITPDNQFFPEIKASRVVDTVPSHQEIFAATPVNIVINTDVDTFDSHIDLQKGSQEYPISIDRTKDSKTTLRGLIGKNLEEGTHLVKYSLDYTSSNYANGANRRKGQFSFTIDSSKKADYKDLTGQKEVTIDMGNLKFSPDKIIISPGTKVNWVNKDSVEHFINTDPHPSHNYYPNQNSLDISPTGNYAVTFTQVGEYPYHCSAHYPDGMTGRIIVQ